MAQEGVNMGELSSTAKRAVSAYGGADRWRNARAIEVVVSANGLGFRLKWRRPAPNADVRVEIAEPVVRMDLKDSEGHIGVMDRGDVRIETSSGEVVASRPNPEHLFPYGRRAFWWDRLDQIYFSGYALWNYMTLPALLLRDDIQWEELREGSLQARFPKHLPTHCEVQQFHFDPATGLLRQLDYTAEAFGNWAKAANVVLEHGESEGVPRPSLRRVTPRKGPLLIGIEFHRFRLV